MTERSARPPTPASGTTGSAAPGSGSAASAGAASETTQVAQSSGSGDTAVRGGFAERLQAKLAAATGSDGSGSTDGEKTEKSGGRKPKAPKQPRETEPSRGPRRARLRLTRIDPWSVMKTAFLLSIAFGVVTVVAVAMIWQVLGAAGVWDSINTTIRDTLDSQDTATFDIQDYVGTSRVVGFSMLVAAVDVVLLTAIATLGAFLYNMAAALLGGIEVTLAEDDH